VSSPLQVSTKLSRGKRRRTGVATLKAGVAELTVATVVIWLLVVRPALSKRPALALLSHVPLGATKALQALMAVWLLVIWPTFMVWLSLAVRPRRGVRLLLSVLSSGALKAL